VGFLFAHSFNLTSRGGLLNLVSILVWQTTLVVWTAAYTANDLFTALDNLSGYVVELSAGCLMLAGSLVAARANGDPEQLTTALQLAVAASNMLIYSAFLPLTFTVYDTFIVPVVLFCWKSDDLSYAETCCQMVKTLIMLPITIVSTFMGFSASANASNAVGLLGTCTEGTLVASSSQLGAQDSEGDGDNVAAAPPNKRKLRTAFLKRVRAKAAAKASADATTTTVGTEGTTEGAEAAAGPPPPTRRPPTVFEMAWSSSRRLAGLDDGQLRVERAVTVTKAAGAAAGVLLTSRITTRRAGAQIAVVRVAPDGPCALAVMAGDVLIGVNHLGDGGAPDLNGSEHDLEAVVAELRQASTLRLRVLRHM